MIYIEQQKKFLPANSLDSTRNFPAAISLGHDPNAIPQNLSNKIFAFTVNILLTKKGMPWIYMISVIAKDKYCSSASKKYFLKSIHS